MKKTKLFVNGEKKNYIIIEKQKLQNYYTIVDDNMTTKDGDWVVDETALGIHSWNEEVVVDRDRGESDESQCFNMSTHLEYKNVVITPHGFKAPNVAAIREALRFILIGSWCPGDI